MGLLRRLSSSAWKDELQDLVASKTRSSPSAVTITVADLNELSPLIGVDNDYDGERLAERTIAAIELLELQGYKMTSGGSTYTFQRV